MAGMQAVLAKNLKRLRELQGKSQRQMATIAKVSQKTISNLELVDSGQAPKLTTIEYVADYFKLHPSLLLMDGLSDEALTDSEVSKMIEQFARLPMKRKKQIMELVSDFTKLD